MCAVLCSVAKRLSEKKQMKRHLETKYPQHVKKKRIYFQHREAELKRSRFCSETNPALSASKQATVSSYVVAQRIAREMKLHTTGEQLVACSHGPWPDSYAATPWTRNCSPSRYRTTQSKVAWQIFHWISGRSRGAVWGNCPPPNVCGVPLNGAPLP